MSLFLVSWPCPQHFLRDSPSVIFPPAPISREVPSADILSISFPKPGNVKPQNLALACFAGRRGGEGGMPRRLAGFCRGSLRRGPAASTGELCAAFCAVGGLGRLLGEMFATWGACASPARIPARRPCRTKCAPPNPLGGRHPGIFSANCVRPCAFPGRACFFVLRRRNARRAPAPPAMRRAEAAGLRISRAPHRFAALGDCCGDYSTFTDFDAGLPSSGLAIVTVRTPSLHSAFILSGSVPRGRVKLRLKAPYTRSEACRFSPF